MRFTTEITIDDMPVIANVPAGSKAYGKANCVYCPLGAMPTQAWLVVEKWVLASLDVNAPHTIKWLQQTAETQTAKEEQESGISNDEITTKILTFPGLFLTKSERLFMGGPGDANAAHLIELADSRYIVGQASRTGPIRSNLRSYANAEPFLTGSNLDNYRSWDQLVGACWNGCGLLGAYPGLPGDLPLDGNPENTFLIALNGLRALTAVLDQLDCALRHNPLTGEYSIVQLGATQQTYDSNAILKYDGESITPNSANAAIVAVHFFHHHKNYGQERDTELSDNAIVIGASELINVSTGIPGALGEVTLWDDLSMVYDEQGNLANDQEVTDRANNRMLRYVSRRSVQRQYKMFIGLLDTFIPGEQIRAVRWRNYGEGDQQLFHGTVTEFLAGPDMPKAGLGDTAWMDEQLASPEWEQYAGPDYGRHTFPNYPRLPNILQVHHEDTQSANPQAVPAGKPVAADSIGPMGVKLHRGRVKRWVNDEMKDMDPCWILFVDDYDNKKGDIGAVQDGYYGPGRLCGMMRVSQDLLPVYLVTKGGGDILFVKVKVEGKEEGQLVQDGAGIFQAKIMMSPPNAVMEEVGDCYVTFIDYGDDGTITSEIVAENGRIYGPAKISASTFENLPVYEACIGEQEWDGKLESPGDSIEKGQTGNVELYNFDESPSGIILEAKAKYKKIKGDKWCIVKRLTRQLVVNQIEC